MSSPRIKTKYVFTTGTIRSAIDERLCKVSLPNGKLILGHLPRGATRTFEAGSQVKVRLSVCDFSHGEILLDTVTS